MTEFWSRLVIRKLFAAVFHRCAKNEKMMHGFWVLTT